MWVPMQGISSGISCLLSVLQPFKLEWQSRKRKAEQGQELFCTCTCASVKVGVMS